MNEINMMIEECMENESLLSEWEVNFIDEIDCKDSHPTTKQIEVLKRIWRKVTG